MVSSIYRKQPLKTFYVSSSIVALLVLRIPFWTVKSLPRSLRPRPSWSLKKCLIVNLLRWATGLILAVGQLTRVPDWNRLETKNLPPSSSGTWVEGIPDALVVGEVRRWADEAGVTSVRIPGYWYLRDGLAAEGKPKAGEKIVYHFHGGAYVMWSAHPSDAAAAIPRGFLKDTSISRVFSLEYRLSAYDPIKPINPFPAALLDAIAGYHYLVTIVGVSPSDIVLTGDSAGGHLALGLVRYLIANTGSELLPPPPSALVLFSPWADLGDSHDESYQASSHTDYLRDRDFPDHAISSFMGRHTLSKQTNPYISPSSRGLLDLPGTYSGYPRTFIASGSVERPLASINTLKELMCRDIGDDNVEWFQGQDCVHDYCMFDWEEPRGSETFKYIGKWLSGGND